MGQEEGNKAECLQIKQMKNNQRDGKWAQGNEDYHKTLSSQKRHEMKWNGNNREKNNADK